MDSDAPLLTVDNLSVDFRTVGGKVQAVRGSSFAVSKGETLAIVGESGSGKSVTARAVMRMLAENAAVGPETEIRFKGQDLINMPDLDMQRIRGNRITMVFQEPLTSLNPVYTVGDQVAEVIRQHQKVSKEAVRSEVVRLLEEVRIPDPEARYAQYPHQLSGGQRQRVVIAMALANEPDLLIADEPTTALDVTVQAEILKLLKDLQKRHGMAIILITHDLGVVRQTSDRVCVMRYGRILEQGDCARIFSEPEHPYTKHLIASEPSGAPDPLPDETPDVMKGEQLRKVYRVKHGSFFNRKRLDLNAVNGVSLRVRKGETLGIVGESGSGKTTLGMSLIRLQPLTSGTIEFGGTRIDSLSKREMRPYRPEIQVVFQDPFSSLNPRMIVRQIIAEGLVVNNIGSSGAEREKMIRTALEEVQLEPDALDKFPNEFSGGQRQRIAIARAMVMSPSFILLDEPTSALDLSIQAQIIDLLRELRRKHDVSYVFISHDLKVVRALCHNVIVMRSGDVVEQGPTDTVMGSPGTEYTKRLVDAALMADERAEAATGPATA